MPSRKVELPAAVQDRLERGLISTNNFNRASVMAPCWHCKRPLVDHPQHPDTGYDGRRYLFVDCAGACWKL